MIFDSAPWKAQLARDAADIETAAAKRASAKRSLIIERNVFVGAYAIRKLSEGFRLSSSFLKQAVVVKFYPVIREGYLPIRHPDYERYFAMDRPEQRTLTRKRLVDVFIRSAVFVEVRGPRQRCEGFLVASDRTVKEGVYEVALTDFTNLLRLAAAEFPTVMVMQADEHGAWKVWAGDEAPPELKAILAEKPRLSE